MVDDTLTHVGQGSWLHFDLDLERVLDIARGWGRALAVVEQPWLCWHVDPDWCLVQQDLVLAAGWTPVVGGDPRYGRPELRTGAVWIDFNEHLRLPSMAMRFPLEFAWLWAPDRVAFWHPDLIVRPVMMQALAASFLALAPGASTAIMRRSGWRRLWRPHRYFELVGCTTAEASQSQWCQGAGWWRHFAHHPNTPSADRRRREREPSAHGRGVLYWERRCGGKVQGMPEALVEEGHYSAMKLGLPSGSTGARADRIAHQWVLEEICHRLKVPLRGRPGVWPPTIPDTAARRPAGRLITPC